MVNDCAKRCEAKNVFAGKRNFSLNKAKTEKKIVETLDQIPTFRSKRKGKKCVCDLSTSV